MIVIKINAINVPADSGDELGTPLRGASWAGDNADGRTRCVSPVCASSATPSQ
jgi:hypothetical protein